MTTRKEAYMQACDEMYEGLDCSRMNNGATLQFQVVLGHTDPYCHKGNDAIGVVIRRMIGKCGWEKEDDFVRIPYTPPRLIPAAGTPVLAWPRLKQDAVVGVSTGEYQVADNGDVSLLVRGSQAGPTYYPHWSVLVEKEEP
jgi:hypothetical protein